ncbi:rihB [Symbiodinium pilosum]|uniref:RihB protein n=1 Tax=Symbiodinium pilosum TaxID=2952 RepID=A0A812TD58_SYMPI|nr:rihB [Symbiodinium pilosum]
MPTHITDHTPVSKGDEPDGFVKVYVDDTFKYSTHTINNNRSPQWSDPQTFDIVADLTMIRVHVFDSDGDQESELEDPIGFVEFCIADIPFDEAAELQAVDEIDGWFELRFPNNLQGVNTDRYAEHMYMREEEKNQARPTTAPQKGAEKEDPNVDELGDDIYYQSKAKVQSGVMGRALKRLNFMSGTGNNANPNSDEQYNAGEIHLKLRLRRVVSDNTALFAKALVPSYMTYAAFIQEEFLPKLDLQELLDDSMDIKIKIIDDMLFAVYAFLSYVLAWRSWLLSGLLFISVVSGAKSSMLAYGFFHMWLALVMVLLKSETWRNDMTTNGMNAPLNQDGLEQVARFNSTDEMHVYLIRMVQASCGTISGWQELVHFAGTVVQGDGEVGVTYDDLLRALKDLWFLDFPSGNPVEKGALVRVNDRRRGTVTKIEGDLVDVDYDEPGFLDPSLPPGGDGCYSFFHPSFLGRYYL